jgi:hypothetical protein
LCLGGFALFLSFCLIYNKYSTDWFLFIKSIVNTGL